METDIETKSETESGDLRTAEQIAMTAHLKHAQRFLEDDAAADAAPDVTGLVVPSDAEGCHEAIRALLIETPIEAFAEKVKRAKLAKIRARLTIMEQGPPTPFVPPSAYMRGSAQIQNPHRLAMLTSIYPDLKPIVDRLCIPSVAPEPLPKIRFNGREETMWAPVRKSVATFAAAYVAAATTQQKQFDDLTAASLFLGESVTDAQALEHTLPPYAENVSELLAISTAAAAIRAISPPIQREAIRKCNRLFNELVSPFRELISAASAELEILRSELEKSEKEFFEQHGTRPAPTPISAIVRTMESRIKQSVVQFERQCAALNANPNAEACPRADVSSVSFLFE